MKNVIVVDVNFLRVYPEVRNVESKVNKVKGERAGALVLAQVLPHSPNQKESNVIELSPKQLDNLCSMHGIAIRERGTAGWATLSTYIGVGKSRAMISVTDHKRGDKYTGSDNLEHECTEDSTNCQVDSIILPDKVTDTVLSQTINKNINWKSDDEKLAELLAKRGITLPEMPGVM